MVWTARLRVHVNTEQQQHPETASPSLLARCAVGGMLMGLANLVPGVSGGTMLVAIGVYTRFVDAISDATRFRLNRSTVAVLTVIVLGALVSIGGLAGVISWGLAGFRWGMYSLFIGLTLGGVPIMLRLTKPFTRSALVGLLAGLAAMIALVVVQEGRASGGSGDTGGPVLLTLAGMAGASAMILPGVSGAYLLLLLGQYERIIGSIKGFIHAASGGDIPGAMGELGVLIPVGIGVVLGVVVVGNILRYVLHHYEKATLGFLLGLLIAAPVGLYPFKQGHPPAVGDVFEGEVVTAASRAEIDPKDWPESAFMPGVGHVAGALGLIAVGFVMTLGVSRLGGKEP